MKEQDLKRLNELALVKKTSGFTSAEAAEYEELKKMYITSIKNNLHQQLNHAGIQRKEHNHKCGPNCKCKS